MVVELTQGENKIMELVYRGYSNKHIADTLFLTEQTVNNYLQNIYGKYQIESGKMYNRRNRAVYIFVANKRKSTALKIIKNMGEVTKNVDNLINFLLESEEE